VTGEDLSRLGDHADDGQPAGSRGAPIGDGIVVLRRVHRFDETSGIADLAAAIQAGDADEVVAVLGDDAVDRT
jgi:ATP-dependent exoDNAse (exonuclease V) alpha subunit